MAPETIVVTRHQGLVEYLKEEGLIDDATRKPRRY